MTDAKANLSISWKAVAIAATVLALSALVVAAIVATVTKADTLSVVALAVAIVAFIIQILVFIVQAAVATEQGLRSQEIYGSTLKVLATIEEKATGTQQAVSTISDRMLTAIIGKAIPEAVESGASVNVANFSAEVAERVASLVRRVNEPDSAFRAGNVQVPEENVSVPNPSDPSALEAAGIRYPPRASASSIISELLNLSDLALQGIVALGRDLIVTQGEPGFQGLAMPSRTREPLLEGEFIRPAEIPDWWVLTRKRRLAAGILMSRTIPDDAPADVLELRQRAGIPS